MRPADKEYKYRAVRESITQAKNGVTSLMGNGDDDLREALDHLEDAFDLVSESEKEFLHSEAFSHRYNPGEYR